MEENYLDGKVTVIVDDITRIEADAIVNAANSTLLGGGGVDGAIHRTGGPKILDECRELRKYKYPKGLPTGHAVATTAGSLKARHVIHTVGPVWNGGGHNEDSLLAAAYTNSLETASGLGCKTVAFPAISTGVYGFPPERAARVVSAALKNYFKTPGDTTPKGGGIEKVLLVFFSVKDAGVFIENQGF